MTAHHRLPLVCLTLLLGTACSEEVGQVVVLIHSDYAVPSEMATVGAVVRGDSGEIVRHDFNLAVDMVGLPFSFGLRPSDPEERANAVMEIEAFGPDVMGPLQVSRAFVEFPEEGSYLLPVFIPRACVNQTCPMGQTCSRMGCVSNEVRLEDLQEVDEGEEFQNEGCTAGDRRCTEDNTATEVCLADGFPFVRESCPNNTRCEGEGVCRSISGEDVSFNLTIQGASGKVRVIAPGQSDQECLMGTCNYVFPLGTEIQLVPELPPLTEVAGVSPAVCVEEPCLITLNEDLDLTIFFEPVLEVVVNGPGIVGVSIPGEGPMDCNNQEPCTYTVAVGTNIDLNAQPAMNARFDGFVNMPSCTGPVCSVMMNRGQSITANFSGVIPQDYALTVFIEGSGQVSSEPAGIDCPGTCSFRFPQDTFVELRAFPASGQAFDGWHDGSPCLDFEQCNIAMTADHTERARFKFLTGGGQVEVRPAGPGVVMAVAPDSGLNCPGDCWQEFPAGRPVSIEAVANGGAVFLGWQDGTCTGQGPVCTINGVDGHVILEPAFGQGRPPLHNILSNQIEDLVVACRREGIPGFADAGRVYLMRGSVDTSASLETAANRTYSGSALNEQFGYALAFVDDIHLDGEFDLAIGAPGFDRDRGAVYILSGSFSLPNSGPLGTRTQVIVGGAPGDRFGEAITAVSPRGGQTASSLLVGAPGAGRAYLFRGGTNFTASQAGEADVTFSSPQAMDRFGATVAALGDFRGNGSSFIAIGAPEFSMGANPVGRVVLIDDPPPQVTGVVTVGMNPVGGWEFLGSPAAPTAIQRLGSSMTPLGDWDGDGRTDIAFGTEGSDVVFATLGDHTILNNGPARGQAGFQELQNTGAFGRTLAAADLNGDGFKDLIAGAPVMGGPQKGAVVIHTGGPAGPGTPITIADSCSACSTEGFGTSVGAAGDINDDGFEDLVVGSLYEGTGVGTGRFSVFYGGGGIPVDSSGANVELLGPSATSDCFVVPSADFILSGF